MKESRTRLSLLRWNLQPGTVLLQHVLRRSGMISGRMFPEIGQILEFMEYLNKFACVDIVMLMKGIPGFKMNIKLNTASQTQSSSEFCRKSRIF